MLVKEYNELTYARSTGGLRDSHPGYRLLSARHDRGLFSSWERGFFNDFSTIWEEVGCSKRESYVVSVLCLIISTSEDSESQ